jgi:hypothetical protein
VEFLYIRRGGMWSNHCSLKDDIPVVTICTTMLDGMIPSAAHITHTHLSHHSKEGFKPPLWANLNRLYFLFSLSTWLIYICLMSVTHN